MTEIGPLNSSLVSVIIPVYNGAKYLAEALGSVFAQDYRPLEVIVVDDGSTDNTAAVAQSFYDVVYLYQENQGQPTARNSGLLRARGEFISFLDADDLWAPQSISRQIAFLAGHPEFGCVIGRTRNFLQEGSTCPEWTDGRSLTGDLIAYHMGSLLARASILQTVGCFDTSYSSGGEDFDWLIRVKEAGFSTKKIDEVFLLRRIHEGNMSHSLENRQTKTRHRLQLVKDALDRKRLKQLSPPRE